MGTTQKKSRITLWVTEEKHAALKAPAARAGKTISQLLLEAVGEIPEDELWVYDPANKELVDEIKQALKEPATIDKGSFRQYLD